MKQNALEKQKVFTGFFKTDFKENIQESISNAEQIDILVSFLMESGVRLILKELEGAVKKGIPIRILTGNYLNITQPSALYLIKEKLGDAVDLRFFSDTSLSFHPKSYYFKNKDSEEWYIGSSNLSKSALESGVEFNYRIDSKTDSESISRFKNEFDDLFYNHSIQVTDEVLKTYSKNWQRPKIYQDLDKFESNNKSKFLFEPRGFQIEALSALKQTRDEGADKALVQAATGVGKTFLSVFDSENFNKILFVAHRNEILKQAERSFSSVRPNLKTGYFNGNQKDLDVDILFASVSSLGKKQYLNDSYFPPDYFDYIIVDEFHHAVAKNYQEIISYFQPEFLLGLTATPERLDRKNIYEICDYNVAYEIDLFEAINKGLLSPFRYYGIYDDTDYSKVKYQNGHYREESLNRIYLNNYKRNKKILNYFLKYDPERSLGFCSSRAHAEAMAAFFNKNGIPSAAVYSGEQQKYALDRDEALKKLETGELRVLFSVDMFNEGLDVPDIDCVLFLRPTESPVVFLQQLGRGLRKSKNKDYLTVLDFLGNYKNAFRVPSFLTRPGAEIDYGSLQKLPLPEGCFIDFDLELVDLFKEQKKSQLTRFDLVKEEYFRIKDELGERPSRVDLFKYMDSDVYEIALKLQSKSNPFKDYLGFLEKLGELTNAEKNIKDNLSGEFLKLIETTSMTRSYKLPVIRSFIDLDHLKKRPEEKDLLDSWNNFFLDGTNYKDLSYVKSKEEFKTIPQKKHLSKIKEMPIHYLIQSGKGFFEKDENGLIQLSSQLDPFLNDSVLVEQIKDTLAYRKLDYYKRRYKNKNK